MELGKTAFPDRIVYDSTNPTQPVKFVIVRRNMYPVRNEQMVLKSWLEPLGVQFVVEFNGREVSFDDFNEGRVYTTQTPLLTANTINQYCTQIRKWMAALEHHPDHPDRAILEKGIKSKLALLPPTVRQQFEERAASKPALQSSDEQLDALVARMDEQSIKSDPYTSDEMKQKMLERKQHLGPTTVMSPPREEISSTDIEAANEKLFEQLEQLNKENTNDVNPLNGPSSTTGV